MTVRLRVKDHQKTLCESCHDSHVVVDTRGDRIIFCRAYGEMVEINRAIVECNRYERRGQMSEYEAKQVGWVLDLKSLQRGAAGFKPPKRKGDDD